MNLIRILPDSRLLKLLIFLSLGLQLIVVSQMYFYKAELFNEPVQLFLRLLHGTILTFIGGAILFDESPESGQIAREFQQELIREASKKAGDGFAKAKEELERLTTSWSKMWQKGQNS